MTKSNFKNISSNKIEFKTARMKIPTIMHLSEKLLPNETAFDQLENLGGDERLFHHIAAMSDIHPKKGRKNPTGTVIASENFLLPQINDTAPNCGMRLIKTNLHESELTPEKIDKLFQELVKVIPTKKYVGTPISFQLALDICREGIRPLLNYLGSRTKNETENCFLGGNFFKSEKLPTQEEILSSIPSLFIHIGKYRLGILGAAGNHFLDLMKITDIKDKALAEKLGIKNGQYVFLMHTGSGLLGQYASYMYTPKIKEHLSQRIVLALGTLFFSGHSGRIYRELRKKIKKFQNISNFFGYSSNSKEGEMFLTAHRASANFGFANRSMLTHQIDLALEKVLGKQIELDMLYDSPHIFINQEKHFEKKVWIHRNGTVRANGPEKMKDHPVFSETGEPVFIPSSMSTAAYLGVGTNNNQSSFFSASHGTGRKANTNNSPQNKKELFEKAHKNNVKLYNAKSSGVILQDSSYYKDVEEVISGMEENQIVKVVAKMQPVAVLMY